MSKLIRRTRAVSELSTYRLPDSSGIKKAAAGSASLGKPAFLQQPFFVFLYYGMCFLRHILIDLAVMIAVREIYAQANGKPDKEPNPGFYGQMIDKISTAQYAKRCYNIDGRAAEAAMQFRLTAAQYPDTNGCD